MNIHDWTSFFLSTLFVAVKVLFNGISTLEETSTYIPSLTRTPCIRAFEPTVSYQNPIYTQVYDLYLVCAVR